MSLTQLPIFKDGAYSVDLQTEAREAVLPSAPKACCWDLHGARLLYTRDVWRYRVVSGTSTIVDFGHLDSEIVAVPAAQLPLTSTLQGERVHLLDSIALTSAPGYYSPRIVEVLACDGETGNTVIYSHREDHDPPYVTDIVGIDPIGGVISRGRTDHPVDVDLLWEVPHCVVHGGWVYAIERDTRPFTPDPDATVAPGRVVRRNIGTLGSLTTWWSPEDLLVYPHSVTVTPEREGGSVFVTATRLFNPGIGSSQRSYMYWLDRETLSQTLVSRLDFNTTDDDPPTPYYLGEWNAAGGRNTGGLCLFDGWADDGTPTFIASGISPAGYNPSWFAHPPTHALFRWRLVPPLPQPGVHIEDLGDVMPVPMDRMPTGLVGNWEAELPELRDL